jgi:dTDP-4-dehydrorhamnose 3,5-epimerase-like enzyme
MRLNEKVKLIPRDLKVDVRGWFLKVLTGTEEDLPPKTGEVYLTLANPGQVRGNHYHLRANEWFTVVQGAAAAVVVDPLTGERLEWLLNGEDPITLYIPAGVAHAFKNVAESQDPMLLVAYADCQYESRDTVQFPIS